ncbi:hypothetical protein EON67_05140 [archaeon]|nr:MAG: hypothetical protein EON67_05140 [archaeon]
MCVATRHTHACTCACAHARTRARTTQLAQLPGLARATCRYDDTNPEAENEVYIRSQADNVAWMGWKPVRVTHSSDYFDELYELAIKLIKKGKAYVCHQTKEQMEASREIARARDGRSPNSPWRDRPVEESLREFEVMKSGGYETGKATLRLKIDMTSVNPTLWDPVAYRIKYVPHPMTGSKWCIYPSYDYSHCIIDSLEHIDYSLCTLEFEVRRDLYYWVLEQLDLYRPYVWEFARLNITHYMLSKRKILKIVRPCTRGSTCVRALVGVPERCSSRPRPRVCSVACR